MGNETDYCLSAIKMLGKALKANGVTPDNI